MAVRSGRIRPGLDLAWLEAEAQADPVSHAYALWDSLHEPARTRFVQWEGDDGQRSYLLLWYGDPKAPVAHWVGRSPGDLDLVHEIPPNAQLAVVPERAAWAILHARPTSEVDPLIALVHRTDRAAPRPPGSRVRRLDPEDRAEVVDFARRFPDRLTTGYLGLDLAGEQVWGAFDGDRLVGLARAPVRLPKVWIIGGVFVAPASRRLGFGRAMTRAAVAAAVSAGAAPALYVRESNLGARKLYEDLGFKPVDRKVWIEFPRASPGPAKAERAKRPPTGS